jgi:hypothetical protein
MALTYGPSTRLFGFLVTWRLVSRKKRCRWQKAELPISSGLDLKTGIELTCCILMVKWPQSLDSKEEA